MLLIGTPPFHNLLPKGTFMKTNAVLQQDVIDELSYEPSIDASNIGVVASNGIVTLTGTVSSYANKMGAEHAAERVCGVKAVADETTVDLPSFHTRNDTDIAQAVLNALSWQVFVPESALKVRVEGGWVTLDGTVDFNYQRTAAQSAVSQLTGVRGVNNLVVLKPAVAAFDLKQKIESAFKRSAELDAAKIGLNISGNKVELTGKVSSSAERSGAELAAWSAPGVWEVSNHLQIAT
jgi:osmotically-inducible protein OsmY